MPPKQNIPNVIGVHDNGDLRLMLNQIGTAIDSANANIGLLATQNQALLNALAPLACREYFLRGPESGRASRH